MKYRKIGLRMCIISIIMIALCIPNQIQIANAAGGDNEASFKIWDENGVWTDSSANILDVFPKKKSGYKWNVGPGSTDDYTFYVENNIGYKATCEIRLEAKVSKRTDLDETDTTYPIKFQLYKREDDELTKLLGSTGKNPLDYPSKTITHTETLNNGETCEYVLSWLFEQVDSTFNGGNYDFTLKVNAKQVTDSDNTTPVNPDDDKKDDNKGDNSSTDNGNSGNNNGSNTSGSQDGNSGNTSNNNKGNNATNNNNQNNKDNLNIDKTSSKGTGSTTTNKKKVNTSDITTPVIYVALMILMFGLILLVKSRKEN